MRYEDLPEKLRAQVRATGAVRKRPSRGRVLPGPTIPVICHADGERFERYRDWEKHSRETGHSRCDLSLDGDSVTPVTPDPDPQKGPHS